MPSREVGRGFLHLNTPASITYTPGHKISISALRAKKSRVETVQLPAWMKDWRAAKSIFVASHSLVPLATDAEEEKEGEGPLYPSLIQPSTAALQRRPFFVSLSSTKKGNKIIGEISHPTASTSEKSHASSSSSSSSSGVSQEESVKGIKIVAHHKVSGEFTFTYPDYDGVLSNSAVPEVMTTPASEQAAAQWKAYYITPLDLTEEEAEALEELQMLWKSKSSSRSFHGAQMRAAVGDHKHPHPVHSGGKSVPSTTTITSSSYFSTPLPSSSSDGTTIADTTSFVSRGERGKGMLSNDKRNNKGKGGPTTIIEEDKKEKGKSVVLSAFDEALRMADDLLQMT